MSQWLAHSQEKEHYKYKHSWDRIYTIYFPVSTYNKVIDGRKIKMCIR